MNNLDLSHARIAVIGSGTMGIGIAQLAIIHGHSTVLYDLDREKTKQAAEGLCRLLPSWLKKAR